jgi:DNA gyrase/topoisomerase IV subunit B
MYCRPLIEAGRVYAGLSPLYHVDMGTKNWKYFIDMDAVIDYVRKDFLSKHEICHMRTKKKFTNSEFVSFINKFKDYDKLMEHIAYNKAINPILLEDIIILRKESFSSMKKTLNKKYPYLNVSQKKGVTILNGLADNGESGIQSVVLTQQFMNDITPLIPYIDSSEKRYIVNKKKIGLYELTRELRNAEPKNMERAKGLGEVNARELGISTLDPAHRKLLRYTTQDITKEIELMKKVNDDKYSLLKGVDISQYEF